MRQFVKGAVGLFIFTGLFALVDSAQAVPQITLTQSIYQNGAGGEFTITPNSQALGAGGTPDLSRYIYSYAPVARSGSGFETFCIEFNAHVGFGGVYEYSISSGAISGGVSGGVNGSDPISVGTAWLYSHFASGTLANYFNNNRQANAGLLQNAIWYLEGEIDYIGNANPYYNEVLAQFGNNPNVAAANQDQYGHTAADFGVYALNLGDPNSQPRYQNQDQLVYLCVPDSGATIVLAGFAFGGLAWLRRKLS